jgi:hypothetical protein
MPGRVYRVSVGITLNQKKKNQYNEDKILLDRMGVR